MLYLAVDGIKIDSATEHCKSCGYRDVDMYIRAFSYECLMRLDCELNVQVAFGSASETVLAFTSYC